MGKYDAAIEKVTAKLPPTVGIDPFTITVIIQAILAAIEAWQKCRNPEDIRKGIAKGNRTNRALVTRMVKRELGRSKFRQDGEAIVDAILAAGADATAEEIAALLVKE